MDKDYSFGKAIILPSQNIRYVTAGENNSIYRMFHDYTIKNQESQELTKTFKRRITGKKLPEVESGVTYKKLYAKLMMSKKHKKRVLKTVYLMTKKWMPKFITKDCGHMDETGFCFGHEIKRKVFIDKYCQGKVPEQLTNPRRGVQFKPGGSHNIIMGCRPESLA